MIGANNRIERLRQEGVRTRLRQMERGAALPGSIAVADVTHERGGWLFGALILAAVWPVLQAMGWF